MHLKTTRRAIMATARIISGMPTMAPITVRVSKKPSTKKTKPKITASKRPVKPNIKPTSCQSQTNGIKMNGVECAFAVMFIFPPIQESLPFSSTSILAEGCGGQGQARKTDRPN